VRGKKGRSIMVRGRGKIVATIISVKADAAAGRVKIRTELQVVSHVWALVPTTPRNSSAEIILQTLRESR
jgi:hypothetical protein